MSKFFIRCPICKTNHFISFLKRGNYVCSKCDYHFRIDAKTRIKQLCDSKTFKEFDKNLKSYNALMFPDYDEKLEKSMKQTKLNDAIMTGICKIGGFETTFGAMEPGFIMASMGSVVGEKITRLFEYSYDKNLPSVLILCSGGARMQEGVLSLMQLVKTTSALRRMNEKGLPLFTVLADPTTGGVTASFAMLGDVIIGEPNALIGFAGPRVIQQTIGQKLPQGFQRSEFLLEHGMIDMVVHRKDLKNTLKTLLKIHYKKAYNHSTQE